MRLLLFNLYALVFFLFLEDVRMDDRNVEKINKIIKIYFSFLYFILRN